MIGTAAQEYVMWKLRYAAIATRLWLQGKLS
jgi:hypothetical protein